MRGKIEREERKERKEESERNKDAIETRDIGLQKVRSASSLCCLSLCFLCHFLSLPDVAF